MATSLVLALLAISTPAQANETSGAFPPPSPELLQVPAKTPDLPSMHPPVVLRDQAGRPVAQSGEPVSAARTCEGCHDVRWIEGHNLHGKSQAGNNCFLCHVGNADNRARANASRTGRSAWAETATLAGTGLVSETGERWQWHLPDVAADGSLPAAALGLGRPNDRACGFCHGLVYQSPAPLLAQSDPQQRMTDTQGVVFSAQRISVAALNIAGRDSLTRPWDVHAERMVACSSCHFSPNHPAYSYVGRGPGHLQFEARRVEITEYLRRPDHQLATGPSMRRCEGCHDAGKTHAWLPRVERHFAALSCESCHVPAAYAPARQEADRTMLTAGKTARVVYRDVREDGFISGFRPVLLPRTMPDGTRKLAPHNLVTSWFWVDGAQRPVPEQILLAAFFTDAGHRPELLAMLDGNHDGKLDDRELVLDSETKVKVARDLLVAAGVQAPRIVGEIEPHEIHHGVAPGRFATRACESCHGQPSRLDERFALADAAPFGVTPTWTGDAQALRSDQVQRDDHGRLVVRPALAGLHVFGHSGNRHIDVLGMLVLLGTLAGAAGHGLLRVRSARRRRKERP